MNLKPCPFCGSENIEKKINQNFPGVFTVIIGCADCHHPIEVGKSKDEAEQKAAERWNTRHYPPRVQQAVERMKPEKPERMLDGWSCPRCEMFQTHEWEVDRPPFCWNCGQALDWSE